MPFKIAIASGKGGTGKTLLATNLADYISQGENTLLVDLDVEEPNDFIFIEGTNVNTVDQVKMIPSWDERQCTLCGLCSKTCKYHAVIQLGTFIAVFDELCHSCYACSELCPANSLPMKAFKMGETRTMSKGRLTFIESRLEIGEEQAVPLIRKTHIMANELYHDIPFQIFDCPPGTSCPVVAAARHADLVILVTEPTPFGLNDLQLAVETMRDLGKPVGVVINRDGIGNSEVEDYCAREHLPVIAKIPYNREIARRYSKGELVYNEFESVKNALHQIVSFVQKHFNPCMKS
jgi:MinD superfamily P-loop ATPase